MQPHVPKLGIPKLSAPLTKAIRTSEGILIWLTSLVIGVGSLIEPHRLPPQAAAIVVGAIAVAHSISRTLLKAVAVQKDVGIGPPIPFDAGAIDEAAAFAGSAEAAFSESQPPMIDPAPTSTPVGEDDPTMSQDRLPPADGANQRATPPDGEAQPDAAPTPDVSVARQPAPDEPPSWGLPTPMGPLPGPQGGANG